MKKLTILLITFFSFLLQAACSPNIGKVTINEYNNLGSNNILNSSYIEVKLLPIPVAPSGGQSPLTDITGWTLKSYTKNGNLQDTKSVSSATVGGCTGTPYRTTAIQLSGSGDGYVHLLDTAGNLVDALYLNMTVPASNVGCSLSTITTDIDIQGADSNRKNVSRDPDGNGTWIMSIGNGNGSEQTICANNRDLLYVTKSASASSAYVGETVTFTMTVTNKTSYTTLNNVSLVDSLPTGFTRTSYTAPSGTSFNTATNTWSIPTMAPAASYTLTLTTRADQVDNWANSATGYVTYSTSLYQSNAATASVTVLQPLTLNKTVTPSTVAYNSPASFIVSVRNNSSTALPSGYTINDTVPAGLVSGTPFTSAGTYSGGVWTLPTGMPSGATYTLTLPVTTQTTAGNFTNTATAIAPFNGTNLSASATLTCSSASLPATFNCVEVGANGSTGRLYTKLSNAPFSFDIVALKGDGSVETTYASGSDKNVTVELVDGSGTTACASRIAISPAISQSHTFTAANAGRKTANMSVGKAYKDLRCRVTDATQSPSIVGCSSDDFVIRPPSYSITSPSSAIKATNFTLQVSATNSGSGYNGTAIATTTLQSANPNCLVSNNFIKSSLGTAEPLSLLFQNDTNTSNMTAMEAGAIYLNSKDSTWTSIDQSNDCISGSNANAADASGKFGCNIENNLSITIIPDHFDINATLSNMNGGAFTYLSTDLAMSANIDVNITAKNSDGNVTKNYTSGCFAKTTSLNLPHSSVPSPLSKILYHDNLNAIDANISSSNPISLSFSQTKFTQGSALPKVTLNFDRNSSRPMNPFDFNLTSADVNNTDSVIGTTLPTGKATFVYGRARAYDMKTDQSTAPNPIELEIYSNIPTGYVSTMPQNILHWYRNLNHNTSIQGSILSADDYTTTTKTGSSSTITVNTSLSSLQNGLHTITITNPDAIPHAVVHLSIPSWLWYSTVNNYDFSNGTTCTQHPCFDYQFFGTSVSNGGVNSGTFQGSDFNLAPAKKIIKKGVKVFR